MKSLFCILVLLSVLAVSRADVQVLTDENFEDSIADGGIWMVKFFAPWCGHCKSLAPTWVKLSDHYSEKPEVHIAEVDCTSHRDACSSQEVRGYPTIKMFSNGDYDNGIKYSGARTVEAFKKHIEQHIEHEDL